MFEYDQDLIDTLLEANVDFRALFEKHQELNRKVDQADRGDLAIDDDALRALKKEKLFARDQMAAIIDDYRRHH